MGMKLPLLDSRTAIKILELKGFKIIEQSGSHVQFKSGKGAIITVPVHPGRDIGRGLTRKIIRDLEVSREEFIDLIKSV